MLTMDYQEYLNKLQKRGSKPYKLNHCLGARDAFHWVRRNKWKATGGIPVDKLLYSQIVSEVHKQLVDMLIDGHEVEFPYKMGSILLTRTPAKAEYIDGEIVTNYRTDWKKTLEYRFNEDRDGHKRIKRIQPFIYKIRYYKRSANYHNKKFYLFRTNRSVVRTLGAAIERHRMKAEEAVWY